jgi:outer membrane protein assembly factor BamD (BamD/ComL family)
MRAPVGGLSPRRHPAGRRFSLGLALLLLGQSAVGAAVITRQEESERRARGIYERAHRDLLRGDRDSALDRFRSLVKAYPRSPLASEAQWEVVRISEYFGEFVNAFDALQLLIDHFPGHFERAIKRQFEIALRQLLRYEHMQRMPAGKKPRDLPARDQVSAMLRIVIENAPHGETVAEASYYLGVAYEKEGRIGEAAAAHENFFERFPDHPLADDAAYQVAYIFYKIWKRMKGDSPTHRERAAMAMRWFLARYPASEKAAQASECMRQIRQAEQAELLSLAQFYEKRKNEKSSAIYYRELASRFPELAPEGSELRARVLAFMEKYPELSGREPDPVLGPGLSPLELLELPPKIDNWEDWLILPDENEGR